MKLVFPSDFSCWNYHSSPLHLVCILLPPLQIPELSIKTHSQECVSITRADCAYQGHTDSCAGRTDKSERLAAWLFLAVVPAGPRDESEAVGIELSAEQMRGFWVGLKEPFPQSLKSGNGYVSWWLRRLFVLPVQSHRQLKSIPCCHFKKASWHDAERWPVSAVALGCLLCRPTAFLLHEG